jgi:hypothetical protein
MDILIFKTDITSRWHSAALQPLFKQVPGIMKYSVDVEDIDHVLRIETQNVKAMQIKNMLSQAGYYCEEME